MSATTFADEYDEPDTVADQLVIKSDGLTKTHTDDFRIYFDGFAFVAVVDRPLPIHRRDEVVVVADRQQVAHGIVADARQYNESTTEFLAVPEMRLME